MYNEEGNVMYSKNTIEYIALILTIFGIDPIEERIDKLNPESAESVFVKTPVDNKTKLKLLLAPYIQLLLSKPEITYPKISDSFLYDIILRNNKRFGVCRELPCSISNKYYHNKYIKYKTKYIKLKLSHHYIKN